MEYEGIKLTTEFSKVLLSDDQQRMVEHLCKQCLRICNSAEANSVRQVTVRFFRDFGDSTLSFLRGHSTRNTDRLAEVWQEEHARVGQAIIAAGKCELLEFVEVGNKAQASLESMPNVFSVELLRETIRPFVRLHNDVKRLSSVSGARRTQFRNAIKRVVFELDRLTWLALEPALAQRIVGATQPPPQRRIFAWELLFPQVPPSPFIAFRRPQTEDKLGPQQPLPTDVPRDWESPSFPHPFCSEEAARVWLQKRIEAQRRNAADRRALQSSGEGLAAHERHLRDLTSDDLVDGENEIADVRDAHRLARHLAQVNQWPEPPPEPDREFVVELWDSPLVEANVMHEAAEHIRAVYDWVNTRLEFTPLPETNLHTSNGPKSGPNADNRPHVDQTSIGDEDWLNQPDLSDKERLLIEAKRILRSQGVPIPKKLSHAQQRSVVLWRIRCRGDYDAPKKMWRTPAETRDEWNRVFPNLPLEITLADQARRANQFSKAGKKLIDLKKSQGN